MHSDLRSEGAGVWKKGEDLLPPQPDELAEHNAVRRSLPRHHRPQLFEERANIKAATLAQPVDDRNLEIRNAEVAPSGQALTTQREQHHAIIAKPICKT